jgi:ketosteroid isomerase-like protein
MSDIKNELIGWLKEFERCVRTIDYNKCKTMFYSDAYCYGTLVESVNSLDGLFKQQWSQVWVNIKDFSFYLDHLQYETDDHGKMACLILPWTSQGFHKDGTSFKRHGRATILLLRDSQNGQLRARHTHFSLKPGTQATTYISKI